MLLSKHQQAAESIRTVERELDSLRQLLRHEMPEWDTGHPPKIKLSLANLENIRIRLKAELNMELFHDRAIRIKNYQRREIYYGRGTENEG